MSPEEMRRNPQWFGRDSWNASYDAGTDLPGYSLLSPETSGPDPASYLASTLQAIAEIGDSESAGPYGFSYLRNDALPGIDMYSSWISPDYRMEDEAGRSFMGSLYFVDMNDSGWSQLSYHMYDSPAGLQVDRYTMDSPGMTDGEYGSYSGPATYGEIESAAGYAAGASMESAAGSTAAGSYEAGGGLGGEAGSGE